MIQQQIALGRLERVDVRQAWGHEAYGFTPWLAQDENLQLLADTLQMNLVLEAVEKPIGVFQSDIVARDIRTEQSVLIENQLERTDHRHLGQLITYASGIRAGTIVWIAEHFTSEHRAALDWLNEITSEQLNAFGVEVELWRIGDSPLAPKFNVVAKPNEWTRTVTSTVRSARIRSGGAREVIKQTMLQFLGEGKAMKYQEIADAAGVGNSTVRLHFKSIQEEIAFSERKTHE